MKTLIVASNMSAKMGGEAILPLHYFRELTALGVEAHALLHVRVADELRAHPVWNPDRFHFIDDAPIEKAIFRAGRGLPSTLLDTVVYPISTMARLAARAGDLAAALGVDVIHQPTPVSPTFPSFMRRAPAPLVIGPMNGGMTFPPALAGAYAGGQDGVTGLARILATGLNAAFPGKKRAARLLVANERTRLALPGRLRDAPVELLSENGVDTDLWRPAPTPPPATPTFVFVGRLVKVKAVDILIDAMAQLEIDAKLVIVGDGELRADLETQAAAKTKPGQVSFVGFLPQAEIATLLHGASALLMSSLRDCGGAVVLEAFASSRPAIAVDWGGPQDYVTPDTGVLLPPTSRQALVDGFAETMTAFAKDPARVARMGAAARDRVETHFTWAAKARRMLEIYESAIAEAR